MTSKNLTAPQQSMMDQALAQVQLMQAHTNSLMAQMKAITDEDQDLTQADLNSMMNQIERIQASAMLAHKKCNWTFINMQALEQYEAGRS